MIVGKYLYLNVSMLKQMNELSQAYKYLANFYLKKQKLDNAHEAASKCLEFAEVTFATFFSLCV